MSACLSVSVQVWVSVPVCGGGLAPERGGSKASQLYSRSTETFCEQEINTIPCRAPETKGGLKFK